MSRAGYSAHVYATYPSHLQDQNIKEEDDGNVDE